MTLYIPVRKICTSKKPEGLEELCAEKFVVAEIVRLREQPLPTRVEDRRGEQQPDITPAERDALMARWFDVLGYNPSANYRKEYK